jgi:hypothetical protein
MVRTRQSKSQVSKKENPVFTVSFTISLSLSRRVCFVMELLEAEDHGRALTRHYQPTLSCISFYKAREQ